MKIERFTDKARQAVHDASTLTQEYNHSQIETEHLLDTLLKQEGGVAQQVIQKAGGNLLAAQRRVEREIERLPRVYGASEPGISPRLRTVLDHAWREMSNFKDEYLSVEHILLAMFDSEGAAQQALQLAGLTRAQVLGVLTSIREAQRVVDVDLAGKYQALERYGRNLTELAQQGKLDP